MPKMMLLSIGVESLEKANLSQLENEKMQYFQRQSIYRSDLPLNYKV